MESTFKKLLGIDKQLKVLQSERHSLVAAVVGEGFNVYPYEDIAAVNYKIFSKEYNEWKANQLIAT